MELSAERLQVQRQIQGREAVRRIPSPAPDPCALAGERRISRPHVSIALADERTDSESVDSFDDLRIGHGRLDEDSLAQGVDRPEDLMELSVPNEVGGLLIAKSRIRCEQPVVSWLRLQDCRQTFEHGEELEEAFPNIAPRRCFVSEPAGDGSRAGAEDSRHLDLI